MATRRIIPEETPPPSRPAPRQVHINAADIQAKREERAREKAAAAAAPPLPPPRLVPTPPVEEAADGPVRDAESEALLEKLDDLDEEIAQGKDARTLPQKPATNPLLRMSDGDRFDHYFEANLKNPGRLYVSLARAAPEDAACDLPSLDLKAAGVRDWGDVVSHVRKQHWNGQAQVYHWTLKLNGAQLTRYGALHCEEDAARQLEWDEEQAVKLEAQRSFQQRTAGAAARKEQAPAVTQQTIAPIHTPRFCTYCKHDLSPQDRYCGGCSRATPTGGVVPQTQEPPRQQAPAGALGELLPFLESMMNGRMRGMEDTMKAIAERLNMPPPQTSQPALQLPLAPPHKRAKDSQGRWGIFVDLGGESRFVLEEAPSETTSEIVMLDGVEHFKVKTAKGWEFIRRTPSAPTATAATPATLSGAQPGTPAYVAEVLKQGEAQHAALSEALGKESKDAKPDLPDGYIQLGEDGPIVPEKLLKKHPVIATIVQNFAPLLAGIAPEDVGGMVKGFAGYLNAQTGGGAGGDSDAEKVDAANERRMANEEKDQKLRERRIRLQLDEAQAAEKKAASLERLARAKAAGGQGVEPADSADGVKDRSQVGSDADPATEDEDASRDQPTAQRRTRSDGAFIPPD